MKLTAQVSQRLVWFDIGPDKTPEGMKCGALTLKTSSPYYDKGLHRPTGMVNAYTCWKCDYDTFLKDLREFTGLDVVEYDTHYTLQVLVDMGDGKLTEETAMRNLSSFVNIHFKAYDPVADDKATERNLKKRGWA